MKRYHLICNAHIDPVWQWTWEEGVGAAISTFRVAAEFCENYDGYVFNHNEALLYEWIEEYEPELFAKIQKLVKEGKWHIMGGWYLQPDCNIPSGEAFVRQISVGMDYFAEKFNININDIKTAINMDPFGHTRGLVQIMQQAGYENYIITRPVTHSASGEVLDNKVIEWQGFNDSKVFVFKSYRYNTPLGKAVERLEEYKLNQNDREVACGLWGVGNHGGGPSRIDMERIAQYQKEQKELGIEVFHSTPEQFFADFRQHCQPDLVLKESLQHVMVGCYTSQVRIKQGNRKLENELCYTEKLMSGAVANGLLPEYPKQDFLSAWKSLLFCQFHDILPGSSVQQVENDALRTQSLGAELTSRLKTKAFFKYAAGQKRPKEGELPILVYNPHPYKIEGVVECEYMLADSTPDIDGKPPYSIARVLDEQGNVLVSQNEKESSNLPMDWSKKVVFKATLEPMTVSRFDIQNVVLKEKPKSELKAQNGYFTLDNGSMRVAINANTGLIDSYQVNGREYLRAGGAKILAVVDNVDPWGMTVDGFTQVKGEFVLASPARTARISAVNADELAPIRVVEDGPVRTILEAVFEYNESAACVRYTIPKEGTQIGINIRLFMMERDTMLKLSFPTVFENAHYSGKTAYGREKMRTDGNEAVAQSWVMLDDGKQALTLINTGTYGSSCDGSEIRMSLVRTAAYCAHPWKGREILQQDRLTPRIDLGERLFDFYLDAGDLADRSANVDFESAYIHQKPMAVCFFPPQEGEKPKSFCTLDNRSIELVTIKPSKNGKGYILRLFNNLDSVQKASLELPLLGSSYALEMKPFEILTLCADKETGKVTVAGLLD